MIINGVRIICCRPDCKLAVMVTVVVMQRIKKGLRRPGKAIIYMKARKTDYLTQRKIHQMVLLCSFLAEFSRFERDDSELDR